MKYDSGYSKNLNNLPASAFVTNACCPFKSVYLKSNDAICRTAIFCIIVWNSTLVRLTVAHLLDGSNNNRGGQSVMSTV